MHSRDRIASRAALMIGAAMICAATPGFSAEAPRFGAPIAPGDLSSLYLSIGADDALDAQSLPKVKMPNRDGFIPFPR